MGPPLAYVSRSGYPSVPALHSDKEGWKLSLQHGEALAPLREEGVLIIGSGSATHDLRALSPNSESVVPWACEFDTWLKEALLDGRYEDVNHYEEKAPHAREAHPWPDHFYPLHVAMGAAGKGAKAKLIHHSWSLGTVPYASYQFTTTAT